MMILRSKKGDIQGMLKYFKEMVEHGISPDVTVYNALIHGYGMNGGTMD
jgi:pentatricopeptide repeat protein